jgi:sulfur-oxidizing protein SoxX
MNKVAIQIVGLVTLFTMGISYSLATEVDPSANEASVLEQGKQLVFDRKKGNCLACHAISGGELMGNLGPELVNMKGRYPDKRILKDQIWDATKQNPATSMPPFGRHRMLTDEEINKVVEYIYSL